MAVPNPEKELARLALVLEKPAASVVVLQGAARWFRDRGLDLLRASLETGGDLTELDGQESSCGAAEAGQFLMDLRTPSLFGQRKVLLLRNAERWIKQHGRPLAETLGRITAGNLLVLDVTKLDGRSTLAKKIKKAGEVFEFRQLYDKPFGSRPAVSAEVVTWLVARGRARGVDFAPAAALFMTEVVGSDPARLDGELTRLAPQLGRGRIGPEELRGALTVSFGSTQFELVDALLAHDMRGAFRSLHAMFSQGLRDKEGKPIERGAIFPIVTSWLSTSLGKLLEARAALDAGASRDAVVAKYGGYFRDRFERQLDRRSFGDLAAMSAALRRAERRLRSCGEDARVLLERLACETLLPGRRDLLGAELGRS